MTTFPVIVEELPSRQPSFEEVMAVADEYAAAEPAYWAKFTTPEKFHASMSVARHRTSMHDELRRIEARKQRQRDVTAAKCRATLQLKRDKKAATKAKLKKGYDQWRAKQRLIIRLPNRL